VGTAEASVIDAAVSPPMATAPTVPASAASDVSPSAAPVAPRPAGGLDPPARTVPLPPPIIAPSVPKPTNTSPSRNRVRHNPAAAPPAIRGAQGRRPPGPAPGGEQAPHPADRARTDERRSKASRADDDTFDPNSPTGR